MTPESQKEVPVAEPREASPSWRTTCGSWKQNACATPNHPMQRTTSQRALARCFAAADRER